MPEMVLPGVYIEVRAEGLITPGRVTVGNIGIVGTASKGPVGTPVLLGNASEARSIFGPYDAFDDGTKNELSLVRSLELAYENGASTVFAVRIQSASGAAVAAQFKLPAEGGGTCATLDARSPGTWGNSLAVNVRKLTGSEEGAIVEDETHDGAGTVTLTRKPLTNVTRVRVKSATTGQIKEVLVKDVAQAGAVTVAAAAGTITFFAGEAPAATDKVIVSYVVDRAASRMVTVRFKTDTTEQQEAFVVADGTHLTELAASSELVKVTASGADAAKLPALTQADADPPVFKLFGVGTDTPGSNGEVVGEAEVKLALESLAQRAGSHRRGRGSRHDGDRRRAEGALRGGLDRQDEGRPDRGGRQRSQDALRRAAQPHGGQRSGHPGRARSSWRATPHPVPGGKEITLAGRLHGRGDCRPAQRQ